MSGPPPPPPPHGENPKTTAGGPNLPPGKYDIFIIPEHSAGSGFLYLPSLKPQWNSFIAGVACTLAVVVMGNSLAPAFRAWWQSFQGIGNMGVFLLMIAIGLGAWSLGRQGIDGASGQKSSPGAGGNGPHGWSAGGGFGGAGHQSSANSGPPPNQQAPPPPPPPQPEPPRPEQPKSSWQGGQTRAEAPPQPEAPRTPKPEAPKPENPKGAWEKAREETRRREEERKAKEAEQKRREEAARRLRELREKEAREREAREKESRDRKAREEAELKARLEKEAQEKVRIEKEVREKLERELREKTLKEAREKEAREKEAREKEAREKEAREREERLKKEEEEKSRKGSTYAYSAVGERTNMWPNGKPPAASSQPASPAAAPKAAPPPAASPAKPQPQPTAKTFVEPEEDAYSFRPYDKPKKPPVRKKSVSDFSETSWAPSASTARTSPPPSVRSPYTTSDPHKIVIRAVYGFLNQFSKTPASQLVSGVGSVTDGLILRITSAGLFVDDDVRGVAQREWDVKAWTLKLIETGEWKAKGLHLMRATIRDQEGKRYLFVIGEEESWKIAKGLQTLRGGTQVRALGVSSFSAIEAKNTLETLGWG